MNLSNLKGGGGVVLWGHALLWGKERRSGECCSRFWRHVCDHDNFKGRLLAVFHVTGSVK